MIRPMFFSLAGPEISLKEQFIDRYREPHPPQGGRSWEQVEKSKIQEE